MRNNTQGLALLRQAMLVQNHAEEALTKQDWANASLLVWRATTLGVQAMNLVQQPDACKLTVKVLNQLNMAEDFANQMLLWQDMGHEPVELLAWAEAFVVVA